METTNYEEKAMAANECANCAEPTNGENAYCEECKEEGWGRNFTPKYGMLHDPM